MDSTAAKQRIDELRTILEENSRRYYIDNAPTMSDFEFDQFKKLYEQKLSEYSQQ